MEFLIVTGMSGAGKSTVLKILEDMDFFCVDNLPPSLIPKFAQVCFSPSSDITKVALGLDIRGGKLFNDLFETLESIEAEYRYKILFLEATDEVLRNRYKETRRKHPLSEQISKGIIKERTLLIEIKNRANYIIETTATTPKMLRAKMMEVFSESHIKESLKLIFLSFGFKHGIPLDADLVFDVRFIPNPFYVPQLKELTGNDLQVQEYVMNQEVARVFFDKLINMIEYLMPFYIKEDKHHLMVAIGCTGGKHRSVTITNKLYEYMCKKHKNIIIEHRDITL